MTLMLSGARVREQKGQSADDWLASWYGGAKAAKAAKEAVESEAAAAPDDGN